MKKSLSTIALCLLLVLALKTLDKPRKTHVNKTVEPETVTNTETTSTDEYSTPKSHSKNTVIIKGLGDVSESTLKKSAKIIENFYGFDTQIEGSVEVLDNFYYNNTDTIDGDVCLQNIRENVKTIYVTNHPLKGSNLDLRGYTYLYGDVVLVKAGGHLEETLIHEMGHTFGLEHCEDLSCIMAINNDEFDSGDFCSKCKKQLNK